MDEDINAADEGSLMHAAAAQFIGLYLNKSLAEYPLETLCEEMRRIFDALSREYEQSGKLKDTIFLTYQKENILKRLLKFVKAEYNYAKVWYGYKPLNVEMSFGPGTLLPLSLSDENGAVYNFKGRIDRVDADGERIFVTDYKRSKIPDPKDMKEGLDLQMPLYLLAAEQLTKDKTVLGGDYFSFKSSERDKGIVFDAKNKPPFFTAKSVGEWDSFVEETKQFITGYIKAMRSGNFKPSAKRKCSEYCPAREICRRFNEKNNGGADGDV